MGKGSSFFLGGGDDFECLTQNGTMDHAKFSHNIKILISEYMFKAYQKTLAIPRLFRLYLAICDHRVHS